MSVFTLVFSAILSLFCSTTNPQVDEYSRYKEWNNEDVVAVYVEISESEAKKYGFDESFEDSYSTRYFKKSKLERGIYKVEVYEKLDSKFWSIRFSKLYMKFRYNPYLYKFDEGVLDWDGYNGIFYKKP